MSVQDWCTVCAKLPQAHKLFWIHRMLLLGDVGHVGSCFGPFGDTDNLDAR
jgi:hypothetical protein